MVMSGSSPRNWHLQRSAPVRADAESLFIPVSELPDASVGDIVVLSGGGSSAASQSDDSDTRSSVIVELQEGTDEMFYRLVLDR